MVTLNGQNGISKFLLFCLYLKAPQLHAGPFLEILHNFTHTAKNKKTTLKWLAMFRAQFYVLRLS